MSCMTPEEMAATARAVAARQPKASALALLCPSPVTFGHIVLLDYLESPLMRGDVSDAREARAAVWLCSVPYARAARSMAARHELAEACLGHIGEDEMRERVCDVLEAIAAYLEIVPKAAPGEDERLAGNGWAAELVEWFARTYGYMPGTTLSMPAAQVALLWRCWTQGPGGSKTGTLVENEIAKAVFRHG